MDVGDVASIPTTTPYMDEEHRQIQETARRYAMEEVFPVAAEYEIDGFGGATMPRELLRDRPAELGLHGMLLPEEYGGLDLDAVSYAVVIEEVARAWNMASTVLTKTKGIPGATEEQKERYYPDMAEGECLTAIGLTEPGSGSDAAALETTAERDGDEYVIDGQKQYCTFARVADVIVLYALTDPDADPRYRGISAFIVDKDSGEFDPPGLTGRRIPVLGNHGVNTWELTLDDYRVPAENLIGGEEGQGFYQVMENFERERVRIAAQGVGLARGALEDSLEYAAGREQFGQPIKEFQGVRFKLSDMATQVEAARALAHHVATLVDAGERCDMQACMAKLFASEMATDVCDEGIQIHGGNGYAMEYPLQRYYRDARLLSIGEGTSNIQRRVIADRLYGE